jgi:hypothetical protein
MVTKADPHDSRTAKAKELRPKLVRLIATVEAMGRVVRFGG